MDSKLPGSDHSTSVKRSLFDRFKREPNESAKEKPQGTLKEGVKKTFVERMRSALSRTGEGLGSLFLGSKSIDADLLDELETALLMADVGIETTASIVAELTTQLNRQELKDGVALKDALRVILLNRLRVGEGILDIDNIDKPCVVLVVGVNGVGKTTTIGKLANRFKRQGKSVMLAAGDTFRAAAVEQLQVWGERNQVPVIAQHTGADSASVVFDGIQAASSRGVDILIADTAGRLHNKLHLMDELNKIKRVIEKQLPGAPHEVLLVLDCSTGQNALEQAKQFMAVTNVNALAITKLDGTAKGGVVLSIAHQCKIPVKYIGVGEQIKDLLLFDKDEFVDSLFK